MSVEFNLITRKNINASDVNNALFKCSALLYGYMMFETDSSDNWIIYFKDEQLSIEIAHIKLLSKRKIEIRYRPAEPLLEWFDLFVFNYLAVELNAYFRDDNNKWHPDLNKISSLKAYTRSRTKLLGYVSSFILYYSIKYQIPRKYRQLFWENWAN